MKRIAADIRPATTRRETADGPATAGCNRPAVGQQAVGGEQTVGQARIGRPAAADNGGPADNGGQRQAVSGEQAVGQATAGRPAAAARFAAGIALLAATAGSGCVTPHQSTAADVNPARWDSPSEIVIPNADTLTLRDMGLYLRCNERFGEDTLTLRIAVFTPDSLRYEEPFTLAIPPTTAPASLAREAAVPYRSRVVFARTGDYRIRITPSRPVRGVEAIGINIQKSE